jgi:hypothetical protein
MSQDIAAGLYQDIDDTGSAVADVDHPGCRSGLLDEHHIAVKTFMPSACSGTSDDVLGRIRGNGGRPLRLREDPVDAVVGLGVRAVVALDVPDV